MKAKTAFPAAAKLLLESYPFYIATFKKTKMKQGSEFFTKRQKLLSSLRRNLFVQQL
jgi:hypothetical protein